ncbi:MAG: hypothetical protein JST87_15680 [Bacteroidetes bacterium]|nr:hypothetical protein [Bacteroidota bacterium]
MEMNIGEMHPHEKCIICGSELYVTDHGNHEITYHCSSDAARFWDYDRGTIEQAKAKEHWDKSRLEVYLTAK